MPTPSTFIPDNAPKSFLPDEPEQIKSPSVTGPAEIDVSANQLPDLQATTRGGSRASLPDWRTGLASFGESVAEGLGDVATQPGVAEFIPQITPEPSSVQRLMESAGLRTPSVEQSPAIQAGVGAAQGVEELAKGVAGFFTSGPGLIQLGATATPIAPAVYLKWTVDMLNAGFTSVEEAWDAFQKSDWKDVSENAVIAFGSFLGAGAAAKHGYKELTPIIEAVPKGGLMGVRVEEARQKALEATLPQKIEVENLRKNNAPATAAVVERINREQAESGLRETAPEASQGFDIRGLAEPAPQSRTVQPLSREQTEAGLREVLPEAPENSDIRGLAQPSVPRIAAEQAEAGLRETLPIDPTTDIRRGPTAIAESQKAIPLGISRPGVVDKSLEVLSEKEFDALYRESKRKVNEAEKRIDEIADIDALTQEQRQSIAVAQDQWTAVENERFRRNYSDTHTEDIFSKMIDLADLGNDFEKFSILGDILKKRGGVKPEDVTGVYRLLPERITSNPDFREALGGKLGRFRQWLERFEKQQPTPSLTKSSELEQGGGVKPTWEQTLKAKEATDLQPANEGVKKGEYSFTEAEVRESKPQVERRKRPNGDDITTRVEVNAPLDVTRSENWPFVNSDHIRYTVEARGVFETRQAPRKSEPVWRVWNPKTKEFLVTGLTYKEAVAFAKKAMVEKNFGVKNEPTPTPSGITRLAGRSERESSATGEVASSGAESGTSAVRQARGGDSPETRPDIVQRTTPAGKLEAESGLVRTGEQAARGIATEQGFVPGAEPSVKLTPKIEGMGGAIPEEFKPSQSLPTANKNASIDADRVSRGESPLMSAMRKSDPALWDEAMRIVENDWQAADKLIARHKENPFTPTDTDVVILLQRRTDLKNTFAKLSREYAEASQEGRIEMAEAARASRDAILDQLRELESVVGRGDTAMGTMQGRAFRARRLAMNEDYSLASLIVDRESRLNRRLTQPEIAELEKISQDQAKISAELAKKEAELEAKAQEIEAKEIAARAAAEAKANAPSSYVINLVESIVKDWDARADRARARLRERMSRTSTGVDPTILIDLSEIGLSHLGHAGLNFAKWSSRMIDDVGEWARPHLQEVFKRSQKLAEADVEKRAGPKKAEVKERLAVPTPEAAIDSTITRLKKRFSKNPKLDFSQPARRIARYYVEQGITKPLELVDAVHAKLVEAMPELTKRETMDALSGYGRFIPLKKDAVSAALRDATGQMQQIAKLEDMASGIAPKKSGPERRVPSDEERRLIKQVEEKKKEGGYDVTDPETQLRTAMQAAESRFVNQIADLSHQINTRTKIIKNKRKLELDDKLKALRDKRDFLKEVYDEIFAPAPLTDAQILAKWKERTQEKIIEYRERIVAGDFKPKQRPEPPRLDQEAIKLRYELHKVHNALMDMRLKDDLKNRSKARKAVDGVANVIRFSRALMTGGEFSAVLRQGGFTAFSHPVLSAKALKPMFEALMSEQAQFRIMEEIQTRPNAPLYERNKLQFTESGVRLSSMEEHYMFRVSEKLGKSPLAKYPIKYVNAFQRAYTTYLNRVRADAFDVLLDTYGDSPAMQKQIAELINVATGRGSASVGKYVGPGANAIFFAPRYTISRFQLLLGQPGWSGNAATRKMVAKEYAKALAGAAVVYSLGMMAGGSVEDDPRSPDFGKIKFGNTRIDPLFGLSQVTRLLATQATGERVDRRGREIPIRGKVPYGQPDAWDVASSFARTKLSPAVGAGVSLAVGKDPVGKKFKLSDALIQSATPITYGDILKAMEEQGVERGTAIAVLAMFGMGVQTYDANAKREE